MELRTRVAGTWVPFAFSFCQGLSRTRLRVARRGDGTLLAGWELPCDGPIPAATARTSSPRPALRPRMRLRRRQLAHHGVKARPFAGIRGLEQLERGVVELNSGRSRHGRQEESGKCLEGGFRFGRRLPRGTAFATGMNALCRASARLTETAREGLREDAGCSRCSGSAGMDPWWEAPSARRRTAQLSARAHRAPRGRRAR